MARFIDANGKRRNRSTHTTNRREAQRIAEAYEEAANKKRTVRQVRETIAELTQEITGETLTAHSLRQFADTWIMGKATVAKATLAFYKTAISKFVTFLGNRADLDMTEISRDDVTRFRNHEAETLSPKTVGHDLKCLRMLFRAAREDRIISEDPSEFVKVPKKGTVMARRPFTIPEVAAVLAVADQEWKSMILFGLFTGQRIGDIANISWQDVDLGREQIRIVTQKTGKRIVIPITPRLKKHLEGLPSPRGPKDAIHPKAHATMVRQGKSANLSNQFADLLSAAGLREKKTHRKTGTGVGRGVGSSAAGLSFHCLRHTAVTLMKDAGVPEAVVMELIGHDSEQMSAHYTHVGDAPLRKGAEALAAMLPDI